MSPAHTVDSSPVAQPAGVAPGQRARNLLSGETMTFRRTSADSLGELVELELELRPLEAPGAFPHRHIPVERFELTSGTLLVLIAGQRPRVARAGDVVEVPSRRWHYLLALERSRARVRIRPGIRFDELLVTWAQIGSGDLHPALLRRLAPLLRENGAI